VSEQEDDVGFPDTYWDQEAVKKIPAIYTNRVFVQHLGQGMMKVNFGEIVSDPTEPSYHASLVMTAANASEFAGLIYQMAQAILAPPPPTPAENQGSGDAA
jgi:hypothetical protein